MKRRAALALASPSAPPPSPSSPRRRRRPPVPSRASTVAAIGLGFAFVASSLIWQLRLAKFLMGDLDGDGAGMIGHPSRRRRLLPARFPRHGTPEFDAACRWAIAEGEAAGSSSKAPMQANASMAPNPTSLVPSGGKSEGFAAWVCAVAQAYIYGRYIYSQKQKSVPPPQLLLEFQGMNVSAVLRPPDGRRDNPGWEAAPQSFPKTKGSRGRASSDVRSWCKDTPDCESVTEFSPRIPPLYRHTRTSMKRWWIHEGDFDGLARSLLGFKVETGMACALNSMWELSPNVAEHEPEIFTSLLPTLRGDDSQDDTLVISLYLRTQWTDVRTNNETKMNAEFYEKYGKVLGEGGDREVWEREADEFLHPFVECARQLEREYFVDYSTFSRDDDHNAKEENEVDATAFSRIVWMVSSDSPRLKRYMHDTYNGQNVILPSDNGTFTFSIPRSVVSTGSEGMHTKTHTHPSQAALAQAFVDWYLIGESDAIVADREFTFGATAALRTARPVFSPPSSKKGAGVEVKETTDARTRVCTRQVLVHPKA